MSSRCLQAGVVKQMCPLRYLQLEHLNFSLGRNLGLLGLARHPGSERVEALEELNARSTGAYIQSFVEEI